MDKYENVIKALQICTRARECSSEDHHGCPYGDDNIIDCVDMLAADLREMVVELTDKLELEMLCANCPHNDTEYCQKNGCVFITASELIKALSGEEKENEILL